MNILAFDTTTIACSVAILSKDIVIAEHFTKIGIGHAEQLVPMILSTLEESELEFSSLDGLGVTIGPGSFSGVRIGLATARGLALATNLPLMGITSLEAIYAGVSNEITNEIPVIVALDARKGQCYVALYGANFEQKQRPVVLSFIDAAVAIKSLVSNLEVAVVGTGAPNLLSYLALKGVNASLINSEETPQAGVIARVVAKRVKQKGWPKKPVSPLYLRNSVATEP